MHMRISYHFLADLHITRHVWNRKWEAHPENKTCRVDLVTSRSRDYKPCHIRALIFYIPGILLEIYRWICPGKAKHGRILLNSIIRRGEKWYGVCMNYGRRFKVKKAVTFFIYITIICSPVFLIHLFCYSGKWRWFLPPGAYAFPTSSFHVPLYTVFNLIW